MFVTRRFCCCSAGSELCCGELPWVAGTPDTDKFYRVSIPISFPNVYDSRLYYDNVQQGGVDCSGGGGVINPTVDLHEDTATHGTSGGLVVKSTAPCGPDTGCHPGESDVPGSCGSLGCTDDYHDCGVCLPYDWDPRCCSPPYSGGLQNCGDPSVISQNEVRDEEGSGTFNFTVTPDNVQHGCYSGSLVTGAGVANCSGYPGFIQAVAPTSTVPASWYASTTEYQETKWTGSVNLATGVGDCDGVVSNCQAAIVRFGCADAIDAYGRGGGTYSVFTPFGPLASAPACATIPYIDLSSYPGAWVAQLKFQHKAATEDVLLLDGGYSGCCQVEYEGDDLTVNVYAGFVGGCDERGVTFIPFGTVGVEAQTGCAVTTPTVERFGISFDIDKWEG